MDSRETLEELFMQPLVHKPGENTAPQQTSKEEDTAPKV